MSETDTTNTELYSCDPGYNDLHIEDHGPQELQAMFETLREAGLVTIEGRSCCGGCTAGAADNHSHKLESEGHQVKGAAYYHEQALNEVYIDEYEHFATYDVDHIYLGFGGRGDTSSAEVAGLILEAAHEAGLEAEWDGDVSTCVKLIL